jgi:putative flippase GtrA
MFTIKMLLENIIINIIFFTLFPLILIMLFTFFSIPFTSLICIISSLIWGFIYEAFIKKYIIKFIEKYI